MNTLMRIIAYITKVRNPPCKLNSLVLQQQQNLGRRFGTSKMYLSPQWFWLLSVLGDGSVVVDSLLIVTPIVGFCNFVYVLLCVTLCPFLFFDYLDGKRELVA